MNTEVTTQSIKEKTKQKVVFGVFIVVGLVVLGGGALIFFKQSNNTLSKRPTLHEVQQKFGVSWKLNLPETHTLAQVYYGGSIPIQTDSTGAATGVKKLFSANPGLIVAQEDRLSQVKSIVKLKQQTSDGVPVFGAGITAYVDNGKVTYWQDTTIDLAKIQAGQVVSQDRLLVPLSGQVIRVPLGSGIDSQARPEPAVYQIPETLPTTGVEFGILPTPADRTVTGRPAYRIEFPADPDRLVAPTVIVDALSNAILSVENRLRTANLTGQVTGPMYPEAPALTGIDDSSYGLAESGGFYYVTSFSRIKKLSSVDGKLLGWLGKCTGGANCDAANQRSHGFTCTSTTCAGSGSGNGAGQFNFLQDVVVNGGRLYAVDRFNNRVQVFDLNGTFLFQLGGTSGAGDNQLNGPRDVAVTASNIYVTDYTNNRVVKYTLSGTFVGWQGKCTSGTNCLTASSVSNGFACTAATCTGLGSGSGNGQWNGPDGVVLANNQLHVVEVNNRRVQVIDLSGAFVRKFGSSGSGDNQFSSPTDITSDGTSLFISDWGNIRIVKHQLAGTFIGWLGKCTSGANCNTVSQRSNGFACTAATCSGLSAGTALGQFFHPESLGIVSGTRIGVVDQGNNRIVTFDLSGNALQSSLGLFVTKPFKNETISVVSGPTGVTDSSGNYSIAGLSGSITAQSGLQGPAVEVRRFSGTDPTHQFTGTVPATDSWTWADPDTTYKKEASNVYYHTNLIRDYFNQGGVFNVLMSPDPVLASIGLLQTCNAYYVDDSINFFNAGGGCEATSLGSDIIYHEYAHGITEELYQGTDFPYYGMTGAMNEAFSDYFALTQLNRSTMGDGIFSASIRDLANTMRYPDDYYAGTGDNGGVHVNSPIFSGALWNLRTALGAAMVDPLVFAAEKLRPATFDGMLNAVLTIDDNDGTLSNGTPHVTAICDAFYTDHGIYSPFCLGRTTKPIALVDNPVQSATLAGTVQIHGTAQPSQGATVTSFDVAYATDDQPDTWTTVITGSAPVLGGVLGNWDTGVIADGTIYSLRLRVNDLAGKTQMSLVHGLQSNNVAISAPTDATTFTQEPTVAVVGSTHGAGFQSYRLELAQTLTPTDADWSAANITLVNDGTVELNNATLGTISMVNLANGAYTLRLTVNFSGRSDEARVVMVKDTTVRAGFPVTFETGLHMPVTVGNFDDNPNTRELVVATYQPPVKVHFISAAGQELPNSPYTDPSNSAFTNPFVLADINGDGQQEVMAQSSQGNSSLYRYTPAGVQVLWQGSAYVCVGANIDHDSTGEFLIASGRSINVLGQVGGVVQTKQTITLSLPSTASVKKLAVGDIDNDGELEIATVYYDSQTSKYYMQPFELTGQAMPGAWPRQFNNILYNTNIVMADANADGKLELLIGDNTIFGTPGQFKVYIIDAMGQDVAPWPKTYDGANQPILTVGDIDHDQQIEIVVAADSQLFAWNLDGTLTGSAWPFLNPVTDSTMFGFGIRNWFNYPPALADLDNDGQAEIIINEGAFPIGPGFTPGQTTWVLEPNGTVDYTLTKYVPKNVESPLIDDLGQANAPQLFLATYQSTAGGVPPFEYIPPQGKIHGFSLFGRSADMLWPMMQFDSGRRGVYAKCADHTDFGSCSISTDQRRCANGKMVIDTACRIPGGGGLNCGADRGLPPCPQETQ